MAVMARRTTTSPSGPGGRGRGPGDTGADDAEVEENIVDIDVTDEMRASYLEYAYSVIYQRALPDARDGLKPVQRRILYQMRDMGLTPQQAYTKFAQVVGQVMGRLHPHGDSVIYDALVRMQQDWAMRLPLIDGHGNFGSLGGDDAPAAYRYTEARLAAPAMEMTASLDEDTVNFVPNYDGTLTQPEVLPAAIPNLLVNGTAGIAVGMATNMAPHNLGEVVAAARHLIANPAYAVRYAHAAAAAVLRWAAALGTRPGGFQPRLLVGPMELALLDALSWLPERVAMAARRGRPDEFAGYLEELAARTIDTMSTTGFTTISRISSERLWLADAARTGLAAGLELLGVDAPERI